MRKQIHTASRALICCGFCRIGAPFEHATPIAISNVYHSRFLGRLARGPLTIPRTDQPGKETGKADANPL